MAIKPNQTGLKSTLADESSIANDLNENSVANTTEDNGEEDSLQKKRSTDDIDASIGEKIKAIRTFLGLTQVSLSRMMNITFQQVQKYEKGLNRISASMLYRLAKKLEVDISYFFADSDIKDHISSSPTINLKNVHNAGAEKGLMSSHNISLNDFESSINKGESGSQRLRVSEKHIDNFFDFNQNKDYASLWKSYSKIQDTAVKKKIMSLVSSLATFDAKDKQ